jgi:preprotein translocase subunit SecD
MRVALPTLLILTSATAAPSSGAAQTSSPSHEPVAIEFRLDEDTTARLSTAELARVESVPAAEGVVLNLWFTEEGSKRLARLTEANVGHLLTVLVNSRVVQAAKVAEPMHPGTKQPVNLAVQLPPQEAESLAQAVARTWPSR